jgi:tRNA (guanosine-2'-O-)-methyltransferase
MALSYSLCSMVRNTRRLRSRPSIASTRIRERQHRSFINNCPRRYMTGHGTENPTAESETQDELEWESFDFATSPKWDPRFLPPGKTLHNAFDEADMAHVMEEEARQDVLIAQEQKERREELHGLSPQVVQDAMRILMPYVAQQRYQRITEVLKQRTRHTQFLFENPSNPSNVFACLRTMDSFGIQHVHIVTESNLYQGKAALLQKQGMRTAMGSAQWLTIHHYTSTEEAIKTLRDEHRCRILASDLNPSSVDIRDVDWRNAGATTADDTTAADDGDDKNRPICIVMGNESKGISNTMKQLVDLTFTLPMVGFAESFNLSVATAITLAHLSASSGHDKTGGPLRPGDLPQDEYNVLVLRGMLHSISQTRVARSLLKKEGIVLPDSIYQKSINMGKRLTDN